jgi:sigma-B regulation protein RsbU (phosphoserine phosphatase)
MIINRERMLAEEHRRFEGALIARDGRKVPILVNGSTLRDAGGKKMGNVAFVTDLTEQKKALALAGQVQRSMTPARPPGIEGLDITGRSDPCEEVGGDYFDFLFGPGFSSEALKVVVGDISGHGVDAALLMTTARAVIRSRAAFSGSPAQLVSAMNRDLAFDMQRTGHFMTLFMLDFDLSRGSARWVRAGHEPALIYRPEQGTFESLFGEGLPLGIDEKFAYTEYPLDQLPSGSILAIGTDGIWEATDAGGTCFGKAQFRQIIQDLAHHDSNHIVNSVFDELKNHTRGIPPRDDITLVVIKIEPRG